MSSQTVSTPPQPQVNAATGAGATIVSAGGHPYAGGVQTRRLLADGDVVRIIGGAMRFLTTLEGAYDPENAGMLEPGSLKD